MAVVVDSAAGCLCCGSWVSSFRVREGRTAKWHCCHLATILCDESGCVRTIGHCRLFHGTCLGEALVPCSAVVVWYRPYITRRVCIACWDARTYTGCLP
jgi:hypothetical protein